MGSFLHALKHGYPREDMPQPKRENGPWGEAIQVLLNERNLRQADLVKATKLQPKTISRITRGFDTQTRLLKQIAQALGVSLDRVLVPPLRRWPDDERRQLARIIEDLIRLLRSVEADSVDLATPARQIAARTEALAPADQEAVLEVIAQYEKLMKKHEHATRRHHPDVSTEGKPPRRGKR